MKILYLDTFSGISGDMMLGLLADLGVSLDTIAAELDKLPVTGYSLAGSREIRRGIEGARVRVAIAEQHHHRTWASIDRMLEESPLSPAVKTRARRIFHRVGEAEATVHGCPIETVHFHEVGAVDSIIDIVGAAIGLELLDLDRIVCAPLPMSHGSIQCAHGAIPLPAPATLEILRGLPVVDGRCDKELVTPTGAAIAAEIAEFGSMPEMTIARIGYGVGSRDLADRPNLLRGILGTTPETESMETDLVTVLESHLDDSTPEILGYLMERLFAAGALDVGYSPLQMKKNRPGVRLTLVCPLHLAEALGRLLLRESSAIGVRRYETQRLKLRRERATVSTPLGEATVKLIYEGEHLLRITPEFDSCRHLAQQSGTPLPEVYRLVERAAEITTPNPLLDQEGTKELDKNT
ncbi:MAG: TIGR00299 family protein [Desulfuromonadaceae bacterium GWC2_58_13]|nr:MAG: TIGR00299 family protein [Desulfuromonadaceae bacterium GWC2_58_13]